MESQKESWTFEKQSYQVHMEKNCAWWAGVYFQCPGTWEYVTLPGKRQ